MCEREEIKKTIKALELRIQKGTLSQSLVTIFQEKIKVLEKQLEGVA